MTTTTHAELDAAARAAVLALAAAASDADGHDPLNEEARLLLARPGASHVLASEGDAVVTSLDRSEVKEGARARAEEAR